MSRSARYRIPVLLTVVAVLLSLAPAASAAKPPTTSGPLSDKVIFFASRRDAPGPDGAVRGRGPHAGLPRNSWPTGVRGDNGLTQAFPPNTGVGWYSLATGAYPGEHGSTNNTFHRTGEKATSTTPRASRRPGLLQADTIQQAAERAGKSVVSLEWVGSRGLVPALQGPVVDFRSFFSRRGVLVNYDIPPGQPAGANSFGVDYFRVDLDPPAVGWTNVPVDTFSPPQQRRSRARRSSLRRTRAGSTTCTSTTAT